MSKYMMILGGADLDKRGGNPDVAPVMFTRYMEWVGELQRNGSYVGGHKLHDQGGARLTVRGGQVVEGPFIETKEAVGGVFLVDAPSLEAATSIARRCPVLDLQNGYVEVRLIEDVRPNTR